MHSEMKRKAHFSFAFHSFFRNFAADYEYNKDNRQKQQTILV